MQPHGIKKRPAVGQYQPRYSLVSPRPKTTPFRKKIPFVLACRQFEEPSVTVPKVFEEQL